MISTIESTVASKRHLSPLLCPAVPKGPDYRSPNAVLASPDAAFRSRVRDTLLGMRWRVQEANGGAEALVHLGAARCEALILDSWLPDLEIEEFIAEVNRQHPSVDLVVANEGPARTSVVRGPRHNELLHALRQGEETNDLPLATPGDSRPEHCHPVPYPPVRPWPAVAESGGPAILASHASTRAATCLPPPVPQPVSAKPAGPELVSSRRDAGLPELIGNHPLMVEVARRVHLVAPHGTPVLIQGATGTGKEVIARAIHRLSPRAARPFVALNCAAIPEALLESELFGHARGAFTGAVQRRTGRIQAASGGTLLLDEIGDMPLALQAKLLRFVESGELQPVGDNETIRVDVRIVAATHRPLARLSREGSFRADLYYRLAVFLIAPPALAARPEDIVLLAEHFLASPERSPGSGRKLSPAALHKLQGHPWPGNVRELQHVLGRALILADQRTELTPADIEFTTDPPED